MFQVTRSAAALLVAIGLVGPVMAEEASKAPVDHVIAVVNGTEFHLSDVEAIRNVLPAQVHQMPPAMVYEMAVSALIDIELTAAAAEEKQLGDDEAVKKQLAEVRKRVLQRALMNQAISEGMTDEAIQAKYDAQAADTDGRLEVHARHILLETEEQAKKIIEELNGGADFAEMAKQHSTGPSKDKGGDLGFFGRGQMVKEFETAAFSIEPGTISAEPVQTQFGYHIIKVEERRTGEMPPLEDIRDQLSQQLANDILEDLLKSLRSKADIKRFNIDGTPIE